MSKKQSGLSQVQSLYLMQVELWDLLENDLKDPAKRKEARKRVNEFKVLLRQADPQYMGGEDVYETLRAMEKRIGERLRKVSTKKVAEKKRTKRAVKKKVKKTVNKRITKKAVPKKKKAVTKKAKKRVIKKPVRKKAAPKRKAKKAAVKKAKKRVTRKKGR